MSEAYIFDAIRTPRGKGKPDGALHGTRAVDLVADLLKSMRERNDFDPEVVDDLVLGCVTPIGEQGAVIARTAALHAGWGHSVPGNVLSRFCGSGLEAVNLAAAKVRSGWEDLVLAGGVESMSRVPMGSDGGALFTDPSIATEHMIVPQGISADLIATLEDFSRAELDAFAVGSHQRAARAWREGRFARSVVPVRDVNGTVVLDHDETVRPDCNTETLAMLKPSFAKPGEMGFDDVAKRRYPTVEHIHHVHHAGNSSGIVDGAALLLIGNEEKGKSLGLKPRARIRAVATVGDEPTIMLTAPAPATRKALEKAGLAVGDVDLFEINEAFAAVVLKAIRELDIDPERVNVNGGAIAMGHPLGATGAILTGTLLDELERTDATVGVVTLCIGGGMGIAAVIERV